MSIHAPRVGSDKQYMGSILAATTFLSTLPAWGATQSRECQSLIGFISIHAPRVGSDLLNDKGDS